MDHSIGPPEGCYRQAPDVGGVPDGGRGGKLSDQVYAGDDARSVAMSGLHLTFSGIIKQAIWTMYTGNSDLRSCGGSVTIQVSYSMRVFLVRGYDLGFLDVDGHCHRLHRPLSHLLGPTTAGVDEGRVGGHP